MSLTVLVSIALAALGRHKLRSVLTMLGLIIGVAAVVTMVALGNGAQAEVGDEVRSAGTTLIYVAAGNYTRGGDAINIPSGWGKATTLTSEDAEAIAALDGVEHVSAEVSERAPLLAGSRRAFGPVIGVDTAYPLVFKWTWILGRSLTAAEVSSAEPVIMLGPAMQEALFGPGVDPIGREITIRKTTYKVIGSFDSREPGQADAAFVPYTALQRTLEINYLHRVLVLAREAGDATTLAQAIAPLLRQRHRLDAPDYPRPKGLGGLQGPGGAGGRVPDDFTVKTQASAALTKGLYTSAAAFILASMPNLDQVTSEEMVSTVQRANRTMTALLASIAGVSLMVGGLGIMNIMLLAVTERTREIGLRMAVGARTRDVMRQFLVEAVVLSLLGGLAGIVFGYGVAQLVTRVLAWPTSVSPSAVALAFGLSAAVGVLFGYYPARQAARLDPIDSLRYE